jgi:hypothetical protein
VNILNRDVTTAPKIAGGEASHFVLTRFNVRSFYHASEPTDEWLQERLRLFRRYCLPALANQSSSQFMWLVFLDDLSPQWFRQEIEKDARGSFETVYVAGEFTSATVSEAVAARTDAPYILTTRVDNDDAVSRDFVQTIQRCFQRQEFEFINLVNGAQYADGKVYVRPYTKNPFLSLVEAVGTAAPETVFVEHHYRVDDRGPVRNIRTAHPMWLQVIHGGNVLNEIVGLRVPGHRIAGFFTCGLDFNDSFVELLVEASRGAARILWRLARKPARVAELWRATFAARISRS